VRKKKREKERERVGGNKKSFFKEKKTEVYERERYQSKYLPRGSIGSRTSRRWRSEVDGECR
jgi:hypothetical protein